MQCLAITRSEDTGTLQYDVFCDEDVSECIVHERYRDSDAVLEHLANLGETATALFPICSAEGEVLGTPNAKLRKALEGGPVRRRGRERGLIGWNPSPGRSTRLRALARPPADSVMGEGEVVALMTGTMMTVRDRPDVVD
jgi:hypothetical protein